MPASGAERSRYQWPFRIAAALVGCVVSFVAVEVTLRILDLAPVGGLATVTQRDFERVPGMFLPGQRFVDRQIPALPYLTTIDHLGYRGDVEFPRDKPLGELRILMLGDSFTFGSYVNDNETMPVQLEGLLQGRCSGAFRVINAGVGGSTIETAAEMADRGLPLAPDVAVLTFTENDLTDLVTPMWEELARNRAAKSRFPLSVVYPVVRQLATWNLLLKARAQLVTNRRAALLGSASPADSAAAEPATGLRWAYATRLRDLRDHLRSVGVPLVFVVFPSHRTVGGGASDDLVQWAERAGWEAGLPTVNLLAALRASGGPSAALYLLPHDGHPSASGHAVAAGAVASRLLALQPVAGHCQVKAGVRATP